MEVSKDEVTAEIAELQQEVAAEQAANAAEGPPPASPGGPDVAASYQEPEPDLEWQEILHPLLWGGFAVLAPAWQVTAEECQQMADAYAPLCQKYMPDGPGKWGPEIGAAFVTVHVLAPRLGKPRKIEDARDSRDSASNDADTAGDSAGTNGTATQQTDKNSGDVSVSAADLPEMDAS